MQKELKVFPEALHCLYPPCIRARTNRKRFVLGEILPMIMNYWKPEGNFFAGDCMPFSENGTFHLYYLLDQGHHNHPIVGWLGGHQWAHASTRDLVHWTHHPLALPLDFEAGEASNCTGSMLDFQGRIYAFYALRSKHFPGEQFRVAVSNDRGITFEKWDAPELKTQPEGHTRDFRDPMAFTDEEGLVHVLISGAEIQHDHGVTMPCGVVHHYTTADLIHYHREAPLLRTRGVPECCDYFKWGSYYYLLFGSDAGTFYRYSRNPFGPWTVPAMDYLCSPHCRVMKTALFGSRRIGAAWIPTRINGVSAFGGRTAFRELIQNPDGTLDLKFPEEMIPQDLKETRDSVPISCADGVAWHGWADLPDVFRISGEVHFETPPLQFGMRIADREIQHMRSVVFNPLDGVVEIDQFSHISQVELKTSPVTFQLIRAHDAMDLEINGKRVLACPGSDWSTPQMAFFVNAGSITLRNLRLYAGEAPL